MRRKALTLIELLVVIAIVAFLLSIILPVYTSGREQFLRTVCGTRVRELGRVALLYAHDNSDVFPLECRNLAGDLLAPDIFRGDMFAMFAGLRVVDKNWTCPTRPILIDMDAPNHGSMYGIWPYRPWDDSKDIPNKTSSYMYLGNGY